MFFASFSAAYISSMQRRRIYPILSDLLVVFCREGGKIQCILPTNSCEDFLDDFAIKKSIGKKYLLN